MKDYKLILIPDEINYKVAGIGVGHDSAFAQAREWGFSESDLCNIDEFNLSEKAYRTIMDEYIDYMVFVCNEKSFSIYECGEYRFFSDGKNIVMEDDLEDDFEKVDHEIIDSYDLLVALVNVRKSYYYAVDCGEFEHNSEILPAKELIEMIRPKMIESWIENGSVIKLVKYLPCLKIKEDVL